MANALTTVLAIGTEAGTLAGYSDPTLGNLNIPQGNIGGIPIDVTIEEQYHDELEITDHPIENGANISDHSYMRPYELIMRCGWSNSNSAALLSAGTSAISAALQSSSFTDAISNGLTAFSAASDYVGQIYDGLRSLQQARQPISVTTTKRLYTSMLIKSIAVTVDKDTSQSLMVTVTLKQVNLVTTGSATLSGGYTDAGPQVLLPGTPSPAANAAVPSTEWTGYAPSLGPQVTI